MRSTFFGGDGEEWDIALPVEMAIDADGFIYVAGSTNSTNLPTSVTAYDPDFNGGEWDIFLAKFTPDLTQMAAATYLGGSDQDFAYAITIDGAGHVYVTGQTLSADFPVTENSYKNEYSANGDVFITKLDRDLSVVHASTFLGDSGREYASGITWDADYIYLTGNTFSTNFPVTTGAFDEDANGQVDGFVAKLDPDLTQLVQSTFIGGSVYDVPHDLALDAGGNIYLTGQTSSADFPVTAGAYDESYNGGTPFIGDVFVAKMSNDLGALLAATFLGERSDDGAFSVAISGGQGIYITGHTNSFFFPTTDNAYQQGYGGGNQEVFVARFDANLAGLTACTLLGGWDTDLDPDLILTPEADVYVTGGTLSTQFPVTGDGYDPNPNGGYDLFISKFDSLLTTLEASSYFGGSSNESSAAIQVHSQGVYVAGGTMSVNLPTQNRSYDSSLNGATDIFVAKFDAALTRSPYDLNRDGHIDRLDLGLLLIQWNTASENCPECDFNTNGRIDIQDVQMLIEQL